MANRCRLCGKALKNEEMQFGDDCKKRFDEALSIIETTPEEVGTLFLTGDANIQRWLSKMTIALIRSIKASGRMSAGCRQDAVRFLEAAREEAKYVTEQAVQLLAVA